MKVYHVSPGGCGSCSIRYFVGPTLNQEPWNAHQRNPDKVPADTEHLVYLYNNVYDTVLSYYRRNFMKYPYDHCKHMSGNLNILKKKREWSLEDFLKLESDPFKIEEHFYGWFNYRKHPCPILFFKYESLERNKVKLLEWYGVSKEKAMTYPVKKRNSDWRSQPKYIIELLEKNYGEFFNYQKTLEDMIYK